MLTAQDPAYLIPLVIILLVAFPVHEFAHAWTADRYGDMTPRNNGRVTLNPLKHLDILGSILLLTSGFGWAKPVPVNPYALGRSSPSAFMFVALAGPMSNLCMALLASLPFQLNLVAPPYTAEAAGQLSGWISFFLAVFIQINLLLMLFNLIPLAPLDGEKVLYHFLPRRWAGVMDTIRPYGPLILMAVLMLGYFSGINIINSLIGPPLNALYGLLVR
jgi:Zn-dependent protease